MAIVETKAAKAPAATMQAIRTPLLCFLPWISGLTADHTRNQFSYKRNKKIEPLPGFPEKVSAITLWQLKEEQLTTNKQDKV